jgi:hypothetical protein
MLFGYVYYLKNYNADFFSDKNTLPGEFIIPVNETIIGKQPDLFQVLLSSEKKFCFSISGNLRQYNKTFIKEQIIQNFVRLLFLPNYLKTNGKHIFFIEPPEKGDDSLDALKEDLYNEFKKQGIKITLVEMVTIESFPVNATDEKCISIIHPGLRTSLNNNEKEGDFETLMKTFTHPRYFNKKWIVPVTDPDDFTNKRQLVEKFETWMRATAPFKVRLIEMYNTAMRDSGALESENELLKFKLENSVNYLQLIRKESQGLIKEIGNLRLEIHRLTQQIIHPESSSGLSHSMDDPDFIMQLQAHIVAERDRANETLNWYKNEYEVLPMWYKRCGQVIKVLIGKRTFKSLFNKKKNDQGRKNTKQD